MGLKFSCAVTPQDSLILHCITPQCAVVHSCAKVSAEQLCILVSVLWARFVLHNGHPELCESRNHCEQGAR